MSVTSIAPWAGSILRADAEHLPLADDSVGLVFCSPPYIDARWYGDRKTHARHCVEWVDWMLRVVRQICCGEFEVVE